jgi:four helix bundle protein
VVTHYKQLTVWQKAMELVTEVYTVTADFPERERFGLVSQLRKAAVSIPSNIAEGQGRSSTGEFKQFLGHARGSLFEVETQTLIAENLSLATTARTQLLRQLIEEVGRLLNGLLRSLETSRQSRATNH